MTNSLKVVSAVIILLVGAMAVNAYMEDKAYMDKIQSGDLVVECNFKDRGWDIVSPDHIKDFNDVSNTFTFDNGSSSTCRVSKSQYSF